MHKTKGGSAQPNIESGPRKVGLRVRLKPPVTPLPPLHNRNNEGGLHHPSNPLVNYAG